MISGSEDFNLPVPLLTPFVGDGLLAKLPNDKNCEPAGYLQGVCVGKVGEYNVYSTW